MPASTDRRAPERAIETPVYVMKAELFKALGHPVRIRTLELLGEGDHPVSELLVDMGIEASHLSQHLAVLRRAGVVRKTRRGNAVTYSLTDDSMAAMLAAARSFLLSSLDHTTDALSPATDTEAVSS